MVTSYRKMIKSVQILTVICVTLYFFSLSLYYKSGLENCEKNLNAASINNSTQVNLDDRNFSEKLSLELAQTVNPNVPFVAWGQMKGKLKSYNRSCAPYVSPLNVKFANLYWQVQQMPTFNSTFYLFGAYLDERKLALKDTRPVVRILTLSTTFLNSSRSAFCQFWYSSGNEPAMSKVTSFNYAWKVEWGGMATAPVYPYLVTCPIPPEYGDKVPDSVSLVQRKCDKATNNIRVVFNPLPKDEKKKDFAVCVKGLYLSNNPAAALRLAEWTELVKILGAQKIIFFQYNAHSNVARVLDHYQRVDNVEVIPITMPGYFTNNPYVMNAFMKNQVILRRVMEAIVYNDCFYQNMYLYNYVIIFDIDEIILPLSVDSWADLIYQKGIPQARAEGKREVAAFLARNVFFMDDKPEPATDIPAHMHMLSHVRRNSQHDGHNMTGNISFKTFQSTERVLSAHTHYPIECLGGVACEIFTFNLEDAHLQQYCIGKKLKRACNTTDTFLTMDTSIWRFKDRLISATEDVLRETRILN
ncbi:uncharacterized protein LOC132192872 [Neocloeon triangulifer]|uniref:uncharacterized protein LOC132192872 n=1 Tax=Neocloeon triangulifer TaxID=2078957 RepID=UPI00286F17B3|nr:uncharacterized protein LOC132192872 [Neocloeon triangulifer]